MKYKMLTAVWKKRHLLRWHDKIASRPMFEESEQLHPIREEERIKVENIKGKLIFVGAGDDVLWDTCKYIRRMMKRLDTLPHDCTAEALLYEHGTHFVFSQSMAGGVRAAGSADVQGWTAISKGVQADTAGY